MKQASSILFLCAAAAGAVWSQQATPRGFGELFNQAPPHVDKALRERVEVFYQFHQDKKFRQADQLVHEDSKDIFFAGDKLAFRGFKIVGITYEENYSRAKVVIDADTDFFFPGFGQMQVNRPVLSFWKIDQNVWWWYVTPFDPNVGKDSPFNTMFKNTDKDGKPQPAGPNPNVQILGAPQSMEDFKRAIAELKNKVTVDKNEVTLPSHEAAEAEIVVSNLWDNAVHLSVDAPELAGLTLRIDKPLLAAGQKARLTIVSKPETKGAKASMRALLTVEEISKVVPIEIHFLPPPNREPKPGSYLGPAPIAPKQP
jgi:hypothetical protein